MRSHSRRDMSSEMRFGGKGRGRGGNHSRNQSQGRRGQSSRHRSAYKNIEGNADAISPSRDLRPNSFMRDVERSSKKLEEEKRSLSRRSRHQNEDGEENARSNSADQRIRKPRFASNS